MAETAILERMAAVRRGRRLEYFTIAWNALERLVAVVAGAIAGSISLVGFGIDSFIEVTSGSVLLWRMSVDAEVERRELNESRALRIVGVCFLLLAAYIAYESVLDLWSRQVRTLSLSSAPCTGNIQGPWNRLRLIFGADGSGEDFKSELTQS
jgi:hypothetical protein